MTITANTFVLQEMPSAGKAWHVSLQSADVSGAEIIKAAESGYTHYLTYLNIRTDAAMDISIGSGETTPGTIDTVHMGPIPVSAECGIFPWKAPVRQGMKCTASAGLYVDSTAGGTMWIEAHGFTVKNT